MNVAGSFGFRRIPTPIPERKDFYIVPNDGYRDVRWQQIRDLVGGGARARAYGTTLDNRWDLIVRLLFTIIDRWPSDPYALNFLASCYELGRGIECDPKKAKTGYLDAANLGLPVAWYNLGGFFAREGDYNRAVQHFKNGVELGCPLCGNKLRSLGR